MPRGAGANDAAAAEAEAEEAFLLFFPVAAAECFAPSAACFRVRAVCSPSESESSSSEEASASESSSSSSESEEDEAGVAALAEGGVRGPAAAAPFLFGASPSSSQDDSSESSSSSSSEEEEATPSSSSSLSLSPSSSSSLSLSPQLSSSLLPAWPRPRFVEPLFLASRAAILSSIVVAPVAPSVRAWASAHVCMCVKERGES